MHARRLRAVRKRKADVAVREDIQNELGAVMEIKRDLATQEAMVREHNRSLDLDRAELERGKHHFQIKRNTMEEQERSLVCQGNAIRVNKECLRSRLAEFE